MGSPELQSTIADILQKCPRFRILLVGKSGVGKSSLINHAFNVDIATVSHQAHGICDINKPIISPQNERFVLHDSQGFEPGEVNNLDTVRNFIQARGEGVDLKDRIHAVWLCVPIPFAGGRVFETGDEMFLRLGLKVPVIVVFTKFDKLVTRQKQAMTDDEQEMTDDEIERLAIARADEVFKTSCVNHLNELGHQLPYAKVSVKRHHGDTLTQLINTTQDLVSKYVEGDVWIVSAMAQRASAQEKIKASIEVGMKHYWQGLASSISLSGLTLQRCLATIHTEITSSWNFNDPENLLDSDTFQQRIMALAQLVTPEATDLNAWFPQSLQNVQSIIGIATSLTSAIAPAVAAIGLSAIFINWISRVYQRTPEVLRCLMGYIVDLTLVMDQLFLETLAVKVPRLLSLDQIDMALETYKISEAPSVHRQIRDYVNKSTFGKILESNTAQQKVIDLIRRHRVDGTKTSPSE